VAKYLLDANVFIEARKRWYGFDFCPAYWNWIDLQNQAGVLFSIERVATELLAGDDELVPWVRERRTSLFLRPDREVLASLSRLSNWASGGFYSAAAVNTFLDGADVYLVAHAHAHGLNVVTHERVGTSTKNVKIPDACVEMGVSFLTPFEMLRLERARFVLG